MTVIEQPKLAVAPFTGSTAEWDDFVVSQEHSSFCHLLGWRQIVTDVLGHEPLYKVAVDGDGLWRGVLPLVRVRHRVFGHYLLSMPFLNYGGPVGSPSANGQLAIQAAQEAERSGADLLELRSRYPVPTGLRTTDRKITVLLELPSSSDSLWREGFRAKLRSQIKRPLREGMEVRFGIEQVEPFYEVFARTMRDLGTPVLGRAFFERIARVFADIVVFAAVYSGTRPVAAGCGFAWRDEFEISWASSLREYNSLAPNMLLYWGLMDHMISRGVRVFNFGRCTPGSTTHRFKSQWGGVDVPLPWVQWSAKGLAAPPSPDSPYYKLATGAWQHVPLAIANRLGPRIARYLP